jgi:uncharacterized membrane protein
MAKSGRRGFRQIFITGLVILVPLAVTLAVLVFLFNLLDNWLAPAVNEVLHLAGVPLPTGWKRIPGLGILATIVIVFFTGLVGSNYFGRRLFDLGHRLLQTIPLVKDVYGGVSQLVRALSSAESAPFRTVVLLEFPRAGIWTLGFVSGPASALVSRAAGEDLVNVFIPAAPIPSQGLFIQVPRRTLHVLPLTTDDAFKTLATLGLVQAAPESEEPVLPLGPEV